MNGACGLYTSSLTRTSLFITEEVSEGMARAVRVYLRIKAGQSDPTRGNLKVNSR